MFPKPILSINIGCFGNIQENFCVCKGIENTIYTLYDDSPFFTECMNYLDKCRLFDNPMFDYNSIANFLFYFKDKFSSSSPIWIERQFMRFQKFLLSHKECGVFLKLDLPK